ncbi:MAG TPA: MEDS domain-containing protein [Mycobacteriales bacterium]|nr:MEDS domain-containing protein [Mycobacteriales bacterium]
MAAAGGSPGHRPGAPGRLSRRLGDRPRPGLSDHACCSYATDEDRGRLAAAWVAEASPLHQRALYVADATPVELVAELASLPDATAALEAGALVVASSSTLYDLSAPIDPPTQLAAYAAAVEQALADGYSGLRVAADITPLVHDPARRTSHLAWEQYADRYIAEHALAPLCLYDVRRVRALPAIVCAHAWQGPEPMPFAYYAGGGSRGVLEGEVDGCHDGLLAEVLRGMPAGDDAIDVSGLRFTDGRAASTLHRELRRRRVTGQQVRIVGASRMFRRVWELCGFETSYLRAS